jgi:hypothetical protein
MSAVSVLVASSFLFYPYLVFSEPAVLQSPACLLEPGRMFPLWLLAAVLGMVSAGIPSAGGR